MQRRSIVQSKHLTILYVSPAVLKTLSRCRKFEPRERHLVLLFRNIHCGMLMIHRTALRRRQEARNIHRAVYSLRKLHRSTAFNEKSSDPRIQDLGHVLEDDFFVLREKYETPKHPIILAHGLLGFDELHLAGKHLGIQYWHGITEAMAMKGIQVITAAVPPSGRIEARAEKLAETIEKQAGGKAVNIIAYVRLHFS